MYCHPQDPVLCSVTVGVTHFERCAFWTQVLYYPFYGSDAVGDSEGDYAEEDPQIVRQKRSLRPELGEPVILRCQPYKIPLTELLLHIKSHLLKVAQPPSKSPKSEKKMRKKIAKMKKTKKKKEKEGYKDEKTKGPSTLSKLTAEEAEHRALQAAVLQEWHILCKERSTEVN